MEGSSNSWRVKLLDNKNFDQKDPYNVEKILSNLQNCSSNLDNLDPYEFLSAVYEFTKAFGALSSALSMGFSDITEKVQIWRELYINHYTDDSYKDMQSVMEKEIQLKIHILNGDNNSKNGHKKGSTYAKYTSGTRTILRLSWFLHFQMKILKNMMDTNLPFNTCIKSAYQEVLAPHHSWIVKTSVNVALGFASSKREPALKAFFGTEVYDDKCKEKMTNLVGLLEKTWSYINNWLETRKLLDLP